MKELRTFLFKTRHLQAEFILNRFKNVFSKVIDKVDDEKKQTLKNHFSSLDKEAKGAFALMDFVHFKGDGTSEKERYNDKGWGLLQVLEHMPKESSDPLKDFIFSAKEILKERVKNAPTEKNEERWLKGWIARIDSYLK